MKDALQFGGILWAIKQSVYLIKEFYLFMYHSTLLAVMSLI